MRSRPSTTWITASSLPSGDQSAEPTFSRTSRGYRPRAARGRASRSTGPSDTRSRAKSPSPRRGDRQDTGGKKPSDRDSLAHARREDLAGLAVPGGGVDDRLPVRRESRSVRKPRRKVRVCARRRRRFAVDALLDLPAREVRQGGCADHGSAAAASTERDRPQPPRGRRLDAGDRDPRGVIADRREIPRQVLRRAVPLLRILRQTALHDPDQVRRRRRRERASGSGSSSMIAESVCAAVGRWNARLPDAIS